MRFIINLGNLRDQSLRYFNLNLGFYFIAADGIEKQEAV